MIMRILRHLAPWLIPFSAHAQLLTNNGAVITTTSNAEVQVNGAVLNTGTGVLNNNGQLAITGDFTHDASNTCFGASQGTVLMNGAAQNIGGTSVAVFNDLTLAGTGDKTLQNKIEVGGAYAGLSGVLDLGDRRLDLNGNDLVVRNAAPVAVQRTTGFIVSERDPVMGYSFVRWNIGVATAGNQYIIPFGSMATGQYLPFTATINSAGTGTSGWIAMATYPTLTSNAPNNRPLPAGLTVLMDMNGLENAPSVLDRFWVLESGGYTMAPTAITSFSYQDPEWSTGTNTIAEGGLQLERLDNAQWQMLPSVINTAANSLVAGGQPLTSSIWTAASIGSPLPIELLSFIGERTSPREVGLHWSTASEHNNAGFEVWRMIEGEEEFTEIAWVDGAGDSHSLLDYELIDDNAATKPSYYRLKQVDFDGHHAWSPTVAVTGRIPAAQLIAFPNPATDRIMLSGLPASTTRIDLFDATGRLVRSWNNTAVLDDLGGFERGVYTVSVAADKGMTSLRVVLE